MRHPEQLFPHETSGLLRRAAAVTGGALLILAIVLAGSASFDPSLGREPARGDSHLLAQPASPAPAGGVV